MNTYIYRLVTHPDELETLLRFRYRLFRMDKRMSGFCRPHPDAIDIDSYDEYSRHYALYMQSEGEEKLLGHQRIIFTEKQSVAPIIQCLERKFGGKRFDEQPAFYLQTFSHYAGVVQDYCESLHKAGKQLCEASRFCIHPEHRQRSLTLFCGLCPVAIELMANGADLGLTYTNSALARFFTMLGFEPLQNTAEERINDSSGQILVIDPQKMKDRFLSRVEKMANAYRTTGQIVFLPDQPEVFELPRLSNRKIA